MEALLLTAGDLARIVSSVGLDRLMDEAITGIRDACSKFDANRCHSPTRDGFTYSEPQPGLLEWMPYRDARGGATVKIVGYHPENPELFELPTILSMIASFDTGTGRLNTIADGVFLTALRTGAASAAASRVLARPDSSTVGIIGCGAQAVSQVHGLSRVFDLRQALLFDTNRDAVASFPARLASAGLAAIECIPATTGEILADADILSTQTSIGVGEGPVLEDGPHKPWLHINAVGSDYPGKTELPKALLVDRFVCADFVPQCLKEGECSQLSEDAIGADLVGLLSRSEDFEAQAKEPTVFDSTGWSLEDHVVLELAAKHARALGVGMPLPTQTLDPSNPYELSLTPDRDRAVPISVGAMGGARG